MNFGAASAPLSQQVLHRIGVRDTDFQEAVLDPQGRECGAVSGELVEEREYLAGWQSRWTWRWDEPRLGKLSDAKDVDLNELRPPPWHSGE